MKQKHPASKSTYRAILSVQKRRDEPSGLYVSDRFFQPESVPKSHRLLWFAVDVLLLSCLMGGLMMLFASGFSVPVSLWFYPAAFLLCVGVTALLRNSWCQRHWLAIGTATILLYLLLLFLCQLLCRFLGKCGHHVKCPYLLFLCFKKFPLGFLQRFKICTLCL